MIAVIQRVKQAFVIINQQIHGQIAKGLLVLVGIHTTDTAEDIDWIVKKITQMRIFADEAGKMNLSLIDLGLDILLVSQFTLYASTKKGNRPSFTEAAPPSVAIPLYEQLIRTFEQTLGKSIQTGIFGADMQVHLINDGPVTIIIDSKDKK
ncbi:MAG: D-aminoacyl-tRNA deacylase [Microscillaceae bacterium]|nr:D-aminoacyl-tRNA deacylase [Microscillaceae bacterium]MDW8459707.1 D-aminoacyl-tRNA deacylase [Cytophagales bacterium]